MDGARVDIKCVLILKMCNISNRERGKTRHELYRNYTVINGMLLDKVYRKHKFITNNSQLPLRREFRRHNNSLCCRIVVISVRNYSLSLWIIVIGLCAGQRSQILPLNIAVLWVLFVALFRSLLSPYSFLTLSMAVVQNLENNWKVSITFLEMSIRCFNTNEVQSWLLRLWTSIGFSST